MKYKDKCDKCHQFNYCKGFNALVLCDKCIEKEKEKENKIIIEVKDGQARFKF